MKVNSEIDSQPVKTGLRYAALDLSPRRIENEKEDLITNMILDSLSDLCLSKLSVGTLLATSLHGMAIQPFHSPHPTDGKPNIDTFASANPHPVVPRLTNASHPPAWSSSAS